MIRQLTVTTCFLFTVSIISTILALPFQSSFAAISSVNFSSQGKVSSSVLTNLNKKDKSFDPEPEPGGDGQ